MAGRPRFTQAHTICQNTKLKKPLEHYWILCYIQRLFVCLMTPTVGCLLSILGISSTQLYKGWIRREAKPPPLQRSRLTGGGSPNLVGPVVLGVGIHKISCVPEQIPMGGYKVSMFAKRLELIRWKNAPQPAKSNMCLFWGEMTVVAILRMAVIVVVGALKKCTMHCKGVD